MEKNINIQQTLFFSFLKKQVSKAKKKMTNVYLFNNILVFSQYGLLISME